MRTTPLASKLALWAWTAAGSAVVAAQLLVPLNNSAELNEIEPFEPPATKT